MPDVRRKLKEAADDLKNLLEEETELKGEELYKAAEVTLNDVSGHLTAWDYVTRELTTRSNRAETIT